MSDDAPGCSGISIDGIRCYDVATSTVTAGCVHEHIRTKPVCAHHSDVWDEIALCMTCWDSGAGHRCRFPRIREEVFA